MSKPWEKYKSSDDSAPSNDGPWNKYQDTTPSVPDAVATRSQGRDWVGPNALNNIINSTNSNPVAKAEDAGNVVGGFFQGVENSEARGLDTLLPGKQAASSLQPNQPMEMGDVLASRGMPDTWYGAKGLGLIASALGGGGVPMTGARMAGVKGLVNSAEPLSKFSMHTLQQIREQKVINEALQSNFGFATKEYMRPGKLADFAEQLSGDAEKYIHEPASKAWKDVKLEAPDTPVTNTQQVLEDLHSLTSREFLTDKERSVIDKLKSSLGNPADTSSHTTISDLEKIPFNQRLEVMSAEQMPSAVPMSARDIPTVKSVHEAILNARPHATDSVPVSKAISIVGEHLASQNPELDQANKMWRMWSNSRESLDRLLGKNNYSPAINVYGQPLGTSINRSSPESIHKVLLDRSKVSEADITGLNDVLKVMSDNKTPDYVKEAKWTSLGDLFSPTSPSFKAMMLSGAAHAALGGLAAGPAGALLSPGTQFFSSLTAGSRSNFARMSRLIHMGKSYLDTPAGKFAKGAAEWSQRGTIDPAAMRELNGRNDNDNSMDE